MTAHPPGNPIAGLSDIGQPGTGPDDAELTLLGLQRVLDGLKRQPAESSSDESEAAA